VSTINAPTIESRLMTALLELGVEADEVTPDTELRAGLDIDSAELVEIVASVVAEAPDGKALKEVRTVGQLTQFLGR